MFFSSLKSSSGMVLCMGSADQPGVTRIAMFQGPISIVVCIVVVLVDVVFT